jgi:hypothetical protein
MNSRGSSLQAEMRVRNEREIALVGEVLDRLTPLDKHSADKD